MNERPATFRELVSRLIPTLPAGSPIVASATDVLVGTKLKPRPYWVVVHTITDRGVQLIHSHRLRSSEVAVRIAAADGEVLRVILVTGQSKRNGDLYETSAEFVPAEIETSRVA